MALLAHGFLLTMASGWLRKRLVDVRGPEAITVTLAYYRPQHAQIASKSQSPPKRESQQRPAFKQKPKKKALKKPRLKKIPRRTEKKAKPSRMTPEPAQKEAATEDVPMLPDSGLSIGGVEDKASPAAPRMASKGPAQPPLRQAIPMYRKNPRPSYPRLARRRGYEGTAVLEVLVNREGKVDEVRLSSSSGHSILDRAAKSSVKKWIFIPAMRDNKQVEMWVKIPIRFQLK
jgi:protein TonB